MTKTGKLYGDSLYELALEKDRAENADYSKELLDELRIVNGLLADICFVSDCLRIALAER